MKRRNFIKSGAIGLPLSCLPSPLFTKEKTDKKSEYRNPIAIATYSFWRFKDDLKFPIEKCIDLAGEFGFDGLDILHIQMHREDDQYLRELKRHALVNGLALCGLSIHQGFISPEKEKRLEKITKYPIL